MMTSKLFTCWTRNQKLERIGFQIVKIYSDPRRTLSSNLFLVLSSKLANLQFSLYGQWIYQSLTICLLSQPLLVLRVPIGFRTSPYSVVHEVSSSGKRLGPICFSPGQNLWAKSLEVWWWLSVILFSLSDYPTLKAEHLGMEQALTSSLLACLIVEPQLYEMR